MLSMPRTARSTAKRTTKKDTAATVSIVSRRAVLVFALAEVKEDAQADSLQRVHEPVVLKLLQENIFMVASPFVSMAQI